MPLLSTASGQRHFKLPEVVDDSESSDEESESDQAQQLPDVSAPKENCTQPSRKRESAVKLWWIGRNIEESPPQEPHDVMSDTVS